ncbi:MAG: HNH endonuclease [Prevotella sp.]|nr:HNH endonuclease [Prevotella sp.]
MVSINDYIEERDCIYKEERYSVRDNGAVMRLPQGNKKKRKLDNVWTFGKANDKTGYMEIAGERVHRIVAYAFHGNPPSDEYVVDHIDTNRRNNRPENLRWLTRLENVLKNPITRARIENICGSVEEFLKKPSILFGREHVDPNFSWMRTVTSEEAKATLDRFTKWAEQGGKTQGGGVLGEWIFTKAKDNNPSNDVPEKASSVVSEKQMETFLLQEEYGGGATKKPTFPQYNEPIQSIKKDAITESFTPNALQVNWITPTEFPCCPQGEFDSPLEEYFSRLSKGVVFTRNEYGETKVEEVGISDDKTYIYVMGSSKTAFPKPWSLAKITYKEGKFYHESKHMFFEEVGARKYFTIGLNREWTDGDVFDDYC